MPVARTSPRATRSSSAAQRLLDRRRAVGPVELVEVDAVGAQAARGSLRTRRRRCRTTARRGPAPPKPTLVATSTSSRRSRGSPRRGSPPTARTCTRRRCRSGSHPRRAHGRSSRGRSRSSTVVTGGMPVPKVIAPSDSFETSSPLAPRRRRSTGSVGRADRGGFQRAERADHQAEHHRRAPRRSCGCRRRWRCSGTGSRRPSRASISPSPRWSSNSTTRPSTRLTLARRQWTILAIGSSMMPVAPASLSAGIEHVDLALGHDGLDRVAVLAEELRHRRRLQRREQRDHARRGRRSSTLSFSSTRPRASSAPVSSALQLLHRLALLRVGVGVRVGDQLRVRHEDRCR